MKITSLTKVIKKTKMITKIHINKQINKKGTFRDINIVLPIINVQGP